MSQILLAVVVVVALLVVSRLLHQIVLAMLFGAPQPAVVRSWSRARTVRAAVADLDREYEELVRRFRR